ncbi:Major facilitator superfamily domain general substrate transporter [Penicillium canescens]|uniref:Major facilitator superfamily domain general substrate transporter n=1 Tax=Penicillium canescens TaxID=5083 RepID=A0AAD6IBM8_PENCN|nr:Major facilitator superfamily domain general substrate transporter [Penicillium canescens]KAJ6042998.1 Major facilitator superfamily domain general substrate transporter [Penicillium canescens]KAJ6054471.1 Major facilitator superfamily domain general substrate transporter [Penicillium canescens]KAJ6073417.1 Major facilitator superfamily domain general substrate transporter [Penicillium canescens]
MVSFGQCIIYGMIFASGALIGYDSGYLNGVLGSEDFIKRYGITNPSTRETYLQPHTRSLFTSILVVGTMLGSALASIAADRIGRKGSLMLAAVVYTIGVVLQIIAPPPAVFAIGRAFLGAALGIISVVSPMYLVESSKANTRGRLVSFYSLLLTCGNVLACGISLGTSKLSGANTWRITIAFQLFLALVVFGGAIIAPESPVLLMKKGKPEKARKSIAALRNIGIASDEMQQVYEEITDWAAEQSTYESVRLIECFQGPNLRRQLLGMCMAILTIATGITFWFGYGTTFFQEAGVSNSYLISLVLALVNAIFTAVSTILVEKVGRRTCLLWGAVIMGVTMLVPAVINSVSPGSASDHIALVIGAVIFIAAYATTWGTVGWVVMTEPYSQRLRLYQSTLTMLVYWLATWTIGFVTPYLVDETAADLGINVCYIWFAMIVISVVWAYSYVPELSGLSVAETDLLFDTGVPAWKSKEWHGQIGSCEAIIPVTENNTQEVDIFEKGKK